ncbi:MAG: hypothetical protein U5L11_14610 [Arhodomonas sp.]|nr:hypothetical protein [Arhodomonas sp.]
MAPEAVLAEKGEADPETLRAVMRARVHVMAFYAREVVRPILREELAAADARCRRLLRRARRRWCSPSPAWSTPATANAWRPALGRAASALEAVYRYKLALRQVWTGAPRSRDAALERLPRVRCAQAEATRDPRPRGLRRAVARVHGGGPTRLSGHRKPGRRRVSSCSRCSRALT